MGRAAGEKVISVLEFFFCTSFQSSTELVKPVLISSFYYFCFFFFRLVNAIFHIGINENNIQSMNVWSFLYIPLFSYIHYYSIVMYVKRQKFFFLIKYILYFLRERENWIIWIHINLFFLLLYFNVAPRVHERRLKFRLDSNFFIVFIYFFLWI